MAECDKQTEMVPADEIVAAAEKLYRYVSNGNFRGDIYQRGMNEGVKQILVLLRLRTNAEVDAMFRRLAEERWNRSEQIFREVNASRTERGAAT